MVQALLNRREYSRAIEQVRLYYRPRLNPDAYRNYITVLMERIPDKETVLQFLEEQAADNPPPEIRFWLANLYWNDNRNSDALGLVRMVAREKPEEKRYWELYLSLLWEEEYKKELKDALEEFCRRWPEDLERRLQLAQAYDWNGDYESEVETLRGLAAEDPSRTVYVLMEARALNNLGRHEAAARILDELVGTYPDSTGFRQAMLETVKAIPDGDIKEIYIKKLYLSADGKDTEAAFLMATGYAQAGKTAEAVRILQEICTSHYNDIGVLVRAGELCRSSQLAEPAAGYYRKALALAPDNETALIGLAELSAEKEPGVSRANLERLESRSVNDAELTWRMALLYDSIQESETAVLYYGRYLDLAERTTADSYSLRRKAWALHRTGRTDKALELYRKLVLDSPGDRDLVNDYAEALIADKQYDKALLELDKVKP